MMVIENKFEVGDIVYLKTDTEQCDRLVTGLIIRPIGILYYLSLGPSETLHYEMEITDDKNVMVS